MIEFFLGGLVGLLLGWHFAPPVWVQDKLNLVWAKIFSLFQKKQ